MTIPLEAKDVAEAAYQLRYLPEKSFNKETRKDFAHLVESLFAEWQRTARDTKIVENQLRKELRLARQEAVPRAPVIQTALLCECGHQQLATDRDLAAGGVYVCEACESVWVRVVNRSGTLVHAHIEREEARFRGLVQPLGGASVTLEGSDPG